MNNNFNIGQFVNKFVEAQTTKVFENNIITKNGGGVAPEVMPQMPNPNLQIMNLKDIPKLQLALLDDANKSALIKELFNLPKDFSKLLEVFSNIKTASTNEIIKFDFVKLVSFLQENGEKAQQKLLNLIVTINKAGYTQAEQLKELKYVINACIPSSQTPSNSVMKNIILLYLPWLPLGEEIDFDINIQSGSDDENSNSEDDSVTILIQTVNFGNIKIFLTVESKSNILMKITCTKDFPKAKAEKLLKSEISTYNITTNMSFDISDQKIEKKNYETKVNVNTTNRLNPFLMLATQAIIRIVIEIDKSYNSEE